MITARYAGSGRAIRPSFHRLPLATAVLAFTAASPAAFAIRVPPPGGTGGGNYQAGSVAEDGNGAAAAPGAHRRHRRHAGLADRSDRSRGRATRGHPGGLSGPGTGST